MKACGHLSQVNGFSPLWRRMWVFRLEDELNGLLHSSQMCGFSPVWTILCFCRCASWVNRFQQPGSGHSNGRSPECVRRCTFKLDSCPNTFRAHISCQRCELTVALALHLITLEQMLQLYSNLLFPFSRSSL